MSTLNQSQSVRLKQTQTLAVTPQMTQRLHILQCNQQQLAVEVQQMLDKNIMLEQVGEFELDYSLDDDLDYDTRLGDDFDSIPEDFGDAPDADMAWEDLYDDDYMESFDNQPKKIDDVDSFQDDWVPDVQSFDARVEEAIYLSPLNKKEQQLARGILAHLDSDYFLAEPVEQLAKKLRTDMATLQYVLGVLRHLDPAGVACEGIRECLLAQLHSADNNSDTAVDAHEILSDYYDYIDKKPEFIRRRLGLSNAEYDDAMQLIRGLSPYPDPTSASTAQLIKPEVFVRQRMGVFYASANQDARFDLAVNDAYATLTKQCKGDEKHFMKAQLQEAKFFLDALDQRHKTVVRVANAIVIQQQDYFFGGEKAMRPLVMREIAEQLDLSESTISRAVNGKYLSFNQRLIELRFFFTQGLSTTESDDDFDALFSDDIATSATAAKAYIKEIVEAEPPRKPLSDSKIEAKLKEKGINISRRTVSKYREAMGIPKTSLRKRLR